MKRYRMPVWVHENDPFWVIVRELADGSLLSRTVREGVRLVRDLRAGKIDVLLELFPTVRDTFMAQAMQEMEKEIRGLKELLTASERTLMPVAAPEPIKLRENAVSAAPPSTDEHDDLLGLLEVKESSESKPEARPTADSTLTFLESLNKLVNAPPPDDYVAEPVKGLPTDPRSIDDMIEVKHG